MATSSDSLQVHKRGGGAKGHNGRSYRILEVIGKGGFGTVYRAELLGSGGFSKQVALKVLHNVDAPEEIVVRFRDEARILGLIHHRAIVKVDSLAQLDKGWAVVMEYVPGVNASSLVKYGPTPPRAALNLIEEVASALHAANALPSVNGEPLRLVHRDIKPANIRLTAQGEVKVLDFGVARAEFTGREAETEALRFGSARYMSPERADGIEGPFVDVYALGLVLAELLAAMRFAEPPKNPERHEEWLTGLLGAIRARLVTNPTLTPEAVERLVKFTGRLLAFEVAARPTARDVERDSRQLASDLPGSWLREWSEATVPIVVSRQSPKTDDPISGSILVEKVGAMSMHGLDTDTNQLMSETPAPTRQSAPARSWTEDPRVLAVGAATALVVLVVLAVGSYATGLFASAPSGVVVASPPITTSVAPSSEVTPPPVATGEGTPAAMPLAMTPPTDAAIVPATSVDVHDTSGNANAVAQRRAEAERKAALAREEEEARAKAKAEEDARRAAEADRAAHTAVINGIEFDTLTAGVVVVTGDAESVVLVDASGARHPAGALPPGRYDVLATFNGQEIPATSVVVTLGNAVKIKCASTMMVCSRQ